MSLVLFCVLAYCIGSISSAVIVCRCMGLPDPRTRGSKNPGATNVLRLGKKKAAIATLLGDVVKGVVPVVLVIKINPSSTWIGCVMVSVFLGHLYPVFFRFQGGKGVATAFGIMVALFWPLGIMLLGTWGITLFCFRISSLAALTVAVLAPFYTMCFLGNQFIIPVTVISVLLGWRHRENIKRLIQKKEPKIGAK